MYLASLQAQALSYELQANSIVLEALKDFHRKIKKKPA